MLINRFLMLSTAILCLGLIICLNAVAAEKEGKAGNVNNKNIMKWIDSRGVTHYGDKIPAQEASRNNTEISKQGVIVKKNVRSDSKTDLADQAKIEQERKDNILLSSYTNAEEIDLARDRNLEMDQATLQALKVQKENASSRVERNMKTAETFQKRNKPIPPYLADEIKLGNSEIVKLDKQIAERKLSMEETRKRFAEEKTRFMSLKQTNPSTVAN